MMLDRRAGALDRQAASTRVDHANRFVACGAFRCAANERAVFHAQRCGAPGAMPLLTFHVKLTLFARRCSRRMQPAGFAATRGLDVSRPDADFAFYGGRSRGLIPRASATDRTRSEER